MTGAVPESTEVARRKRRVQPGDDCLLPGDHVTIVDARTRERLARARVVSVQPCELRLAPDCALGGRGRQVLLLWNSSDRQLAARAELVASVRRELKYKLLSPWEPDERRKHPRFTTRLQAHLQYADGEVPVSARLLDISLGGARLLVPTAPAANTTRVGFSALGQHIEFVATVVDSRSTPAGFEVRVSFQSSEPEDWRLLERLVDVMGALDRHGRDLLNT